MSKIFVSRRVSDAAREANRYSLLRELKTFLDNTTLHTWRHLAQTDRPALERVMWFCVHVAMVTCTILIIQTTWESFNYNPLITTLHDTIYPSAQVPFPGVSICNINRISRNASIQLARQLTQRDEEGRSEQFFLDRISLFGKLYDQHVHDAQDENELRNFQAILDQYSKSDTFDTYKIMRRLSPRCEDMLIRCFWLSKEYKCLEDDKMFETRRTTYGYCCSFNYRAEYAGEVEQQPYFADITGPAMGLVVVIDGIINDYFYPIFPSIGFSVLVHDPREYPDMMTGNLAERFAALGRETFIRVDAYTKRSVPEVARYSRATRKCEISTDNYTQSFCMINCKARSIAALCNCIMFQMPMTNNESTEFNHLQPCNLQHIPCLRKYQIKWTTISTQIFDTKGLEREREESLFCPECLPSCDGTKYQVTTSSLPLFSSKRKGFSITGGISNISDVSLIRVYFGQPETLLYQQAVQLHWFEIFSNFGGMFGVLMGFSLISATELIYFIIRQIIFHILDKWANFWESRQQEIIILP